MNIYQIKQELISIFDRIEENLGEITPELEEELSIQEENFKNKVEDYTKVIKLLENDIDSIKLEQKRLKELADSKQKIIKRLTNIIIDAVEEFGETKQSGVRYIDYGTGNVSVRNNKAVDVNEDLLKNISVDIKHVLSYMKDTNQFDVEDRLNCENLIEAISGTHYYTDGTFGYGPAITEDDLNHTDVKVSFKIPISSITNGETYPIFKEILRHCENYDLEALVSKANIKKDLEENGACAPNLAKLAINKSIIIK